MTIDPIIHAYFVALGRKGGAAGTGKAKAGRRADRVRAGRLGGLASAKAKALAKALAATAHGNVPKTGTFSA